jgi:hypothetical protein
MRPIEYLFESVSGSGSSPHAKIGIELQQMWQRELGVKVELRQMEKQVYLSAQKSLDATSPAAPGSAITMTRTRSSTFPRQQRKQSHRLEACPLRSIDGRSRRSPISPGAPKFFVRPKPF